MKNTADRKLIIFMLIIISIAIVDLIGMIAYATAIPCKDDDDKLYENRHALDNPIDVDEEKVDSILNEKLIPYIKANSKSFTGSKDADNVTVIENHRILASELRDNKIYVYLYVCMNIEKSGMEKPYRGGTMFTLIVDRDYNYLELHSPIGEDSALFDQDYWVKDYDIKQKYNNSIVEDKCY